MQLRTHLRIHNPHEAPRLLDVLFLSNHTPSALVFQPFKSVVLFLVSNSCRWGLTTFFCSDDLSTISLFYKFAEPFIHSLSFVFSPFFPNPPLGFSRSSTCPHPSHTAGLTNIRPPTRRFPRPRVLEAGRKQEGDVYIVPRPVGPKSCRIPIVIIVV